MTHIFILLAWFAIGLLIGFFGLEFFALRRRVNEQSKTINVILCWQDAHSGLHDAEYVADDVIRRFSEKAARQ